jgi:hypothetical protein
MVLWHCGLDHERAAACQLADAIIDGLKSRERNGLIVRAIACAG